MIPGETLTKREERRITSENRVLHTLGQLQLYVSDNDVPTRRDRWALRGFHGLTTLILGAGLSSIGEGLYSSFSHSIQATGEVNAGLAIGLIGFALEAYRAGLSKQYAQGEI